jgi:hypothetical protein
MAEPTDTRVAVYIDFDNIVISRYDQIHGRGSFQKDRPQGAPGSRSKGSSEFESRSNQAQVDVGAILDYASSFGTIIISRAYADWSATVNADYRRQLVNRAIDLTQLFSVTAGMKNGADIRLAVDVVEDLFRLPNLTHVVIVAGDSDYIALAQRSRKLGRFVVGIGVAGSTSRALAAACNEFSDYDALPGVAAAEPDVVLPAASEPADAAPSRKAASRHTAEQPATPVVEDAADETSEISPTSATKLLVRALILGHSTDDAEWLSTASVKNQMKRMDARFNERRLGYKNFSDFAKSRNNITEFEKESANQKMRLRPTYKPAGKQDQ